MSGEIVAPSSSVIGVVLITRHGDRLGYYQNPTSYSASDTSITPLGSLQTYQSGLQLRQRYLSNDSSNAIQGVDWPRIQLSEVDFSADAAEGQVIVDSAYSVAQGLFPINLEAGTEVLGNGSSVTAPLGGYIYVPITTVEPAEEISLEGFTSCPTFASRNTALYNTTYFNDIQAANEDYFNTIKPLLDNRAVTFANMYNVFDYMNVQNIHNATFHNEVTNNGTNNYIMEQARYLANLHEQAIFTDTTPTGIGNIAGQTIIPPILNAMEQFANGTADGLKLVYIGVAYKPFLSLFNMTDVGIDGMVDYASALALEVRNSSSGLTVSFNFRNGSAIASDGASNDFVTYPILNTTSNEISYDTFRNTLSPWGISDLTTWCNKCNNTQTRGCDLVYAVTQAEDEATNAGHGGTKPAVAGVIGGVIGLAIGLLIFGGFAFWRKKQNRGNGYVGGKSYQREESNEYEMAGQSDRKGGVEI